MTWPLKDKFNPGGPISQVPLEWFQDVARILNHLGGVNCRIEKTAVPSEGNPWQIIVEQAGLEGLPLHSAGTDGYVLTSNGTAAPTWQEIPDMLLPDQTGHTGHFLTTDGADASWAEVPGLADGTATGQIIVWNHTAGEWQVLSIGTAGQVLNVSSGSPAWAKILPANIDGTTASGGPDGQNQAIVSLILTGGVYSLGWREVAVAPTDPGFPSGMLWWNQTSRTWDIHASSLGRVPVAYLEAGSGAADRIVKFDASGTPSTVVYAAGTTGTATGQIQYWNNTTSAWVNLNIGSTDQVLTVSSGVPSWATAGSKAFPTGGSTSMVLQKASATNYDVEWDWVRTV